MRDLLLPAPLEDHNVLWPPLDLLATSPLSGDVQPLTEHGAPNYQLLGLVLNELLQLAELPYAHVPNLFSAAGYLAATTTLDYENGQRYKRLLRQVQDVTGPIRTEYFRPHLSLPSQEAPLAREYAVQVLRTMKATHQKHGSAAMHQFREDIWDAFEELDELLQTPHPLNQVVSWTLGMKALLMFHRAPGMPVSAETEIGVNLTGLSPDFAWREISYGSQHELMCAIEMLENYSAILKKRYLISGSLPSLETGKL